MIQVYMGLSQKGNTPKKTANSTGENDKHWDLGHCGNQPFSIKSKCESHFNLRFWMVEPSGFMGFLDNHIPSTKQNTETMVL
jgi:hypothetical protein